MLEGETNKLAKLTKALVERPAINLEIDSSVDPDGDRHALARFEVRNQLKTARLAELAATGQTPPEVESFELDPANYERLLRAEFVKVYGNKLDRRYWRTCKRRPRRTLEWPQSAATRIDRRRRR